MDIISELWRTFNNSSSNENNNNTLPVRNEKKKRKSTWKDFFFIREDEIKEQWRRPIKRFLLAEV